MTVTDRSVYVDRLLRFLTTFSSLAETEDQLDFLEDRLEGLAELGRVADHGARWRALQLLHALLAGMPTDAGLSEGVVESLLVTLLERARLDPKPAARAPSPRGRWRASPDPGERGDFGACPVTALLADLVRCDTSRDVRKAALASLPTCPAAAVLFLEHTLDPDDEVRRIVFLALAEKLRMDALVPAQRRVLLLRGLRDRAESVVQAATGLLKAWSTSLEHDPVALVEALDDAGADGDVIETAELALHCLLSKEILSGPALLAAWAQSGRSLAACCAEGASCDAVGRAEALAWRIVCERVAAEASASGQRAASELGANARIQAAAASEALEALEAFLPGGWTEAAGALEPLLFASDPEAAFVADQLLLLCSRCLDTDDAESRRRAGELAMRVALCGEEAAEGDEAGEAFVSYQSLSPTRLRALELVLSSASSWPGELARRGICALADRLAGDVDSEPRGPAPGARTALQVVPALLARAASRASLPASRSCPACCARWAGGSTRCAPPMGEPEDAEAAPRDRAGLAMAEAVGRLLVRQSLGGPDEAGLDAALEAITTLLLLAFDPVTEPCARFRQGLTVLFEVLAALSLPAQDLLATALLPAARRAASEDALRRGEAASGQAPALVRFVAQLLQVPVASADADGARTLVRADHVALAGAVAQELVQIAGSGAGGPQARAHVVALAKLLALLGRASTGAPVLERRARCAPRPWRWARRSGACSPSLGVTAAREVAAAALRLQQAAGGDEDGGAIDAARLQAALASARETHRDLVAAAAFPFAGGSTRAAGRTAARSIKRDEEDDESEGTSDEDDAPRKSTTASATVQHGTRSSSDEDDASPSSDNDDSDSAAWKENSTPISVGKGRRASRRRSVLAANQLSD
ncbi:hypothetical protein QBZ16_003313 [Prototheca wickerhamii]|uniref:Nuclear condensin complex subunit 3 C-terminal domain-containing protein n=1 Tax=Prototheca wickerhamii TaxID=3111 RepID=A0AAD9IHQ3_PROWI|nr:hypothetical protein QBZ16_003313 [Prototheca wickerhamii]